MATLRSLISVSDAENKNVRYEYFLYSYPEQIFWDKVLEMEQAWDIPVREIVRDELYLKGIVEDRSDVCRVGPRIRKKIKQFLVDHPMPVLEWEVKNQSLRNRQIDGLKKLREYGMGHGYLILYYSEENCLLMWEKQKTGILLNAGRSFAYVYQGGLSYNMDRNMPLLGYFQLSASDVVTKFKQVINGELKERTQALSERRKQFIIRRKNRWKRFNEKRSK